MKLINSVNWLDSIPTEEAAEETLANANNTSDKSTSASNKADQNEKAASKTDAQSTQKQETEKVAAVKVDEIVKRTKDIKKALSMLKNDIMPRYKKRETTARDASFVNALIKAGNLYITKLNLAEDKVVQKFNDQKNQISKGLPQWELLAKKIEENKEGNGKDTSLRTELKKSIQQINTYRDEIKEILKRVKLASL